MANKTIKIATKAPVEIPTIKPVPVKKAVVSKVPIDLADKSEKADPLKAIEKQIKNFEPLELSEGLGYNAQKVYTIHNVWAKNKPLIDHLAKDLKGTLKKQYDELVGTLNSINPNPGA